MHQEFYSSRVAAWVPTLREHHAESSSSFTKHNTFQEDFTRVNFGFQPKSIP